MEIGQNTTIFVAGAVTPILAAYLDSTVTIMLPWIIFVLTAIVADLIAGIVKSIKLGVHVSPSSAFRATMGKVVVYISFVLMVCVLDVVSHGSGSIAKWCCFFIAALEIGSVVSNILAPYGINISTKAIIKMFMKRTPFRLDESEASEVVCEERKEKIRKREQEKWNTRGSSRRKKQQNEEKE